jgi:hypothetical protein
MGEGRTTQRHMSLRRRLSAAVVIAGLANGAGLGAPAMAAREDYPVANSCVQAADLAGGGGLFVESEHAAVMAGMRCRYTAATSGGYLAPPHDWHVTIERADGDRRTFSAVAGSPSCAEGVIARGDRVEIASTAGMIAGPHIRCAP